MPYTAYIQLQVKDQQGVDAHFQIKKSTTMRKLMDEYCRRFVPQGSHVRFLVQGEVIAQEDTADKLGLKEGDLIIAVLDEDRAVSYGGSGDSGGSVVAFHVLFWLAHDTLHGRSKTAASGAPTWKLV